MLINKLFGAALFLAYTASCQAAINLQGIYLQAQGGIGGIYTKDYEANSTPFNQVSLRDGGVYRLSIGYLFTQNPLNYGLELAYAGYPNNNYAFAFPSLPAQGTEEYSGYAVDVLAVLKYTLIKDFYVQAKAGGAYVSQTFNGKASALHTAFALNTTNNQIEPELAAGLGYQATKNLDINLSYHYIFAGTADPFADSVINQNGLIQTSSVGLFMAGIAWHFV